ncbi:MAG: histidinol-phosphate transaminase [Clostridia bacterium]|nr:histidinol-phosphate transaminase [Clostridia bacterium]
MSRFLDPRYSGLKEYVPGEQPRDRKYIKLNTNESPFPPSASVMKCATESETADLRLYSDPSQTVLRKKLADHYGVKPENVLVGDGSDEVLNFCFMCFAHGRAAFADITYGFYKVLADLHSIETRIVPLADDFTVDPAKYEGIGIFTVIANPNAPTGIALKVSDIERIVASNPDSVVVVDEAYVDFGAESCLPLIEKYDNLAVVRTYSKSFSLAGARLGYCFADAGLISDLDRIRNSCNPYNVGRLSLLAGAAAIDDAAYYELNCGRIAVNREYTTAKLGELGFCVLPSSANFVFASHPGISGKELYSGLKERGILVRYFDLPRIDGHIRITIGTKEQTDALIAALSEMIGGDR